MILEKKMKRIVFSMFFLAIVIAGVGVGRELYMEKQCLNQLNSGEIKKVMNNPFIPRLKDEEVLKIADKIMGNSTYVSANSDKIEYDEVYPFHKFVPASSTNLHAQSLADVEYLLKAFEISGDENFILKAGKIIEQWICYEKSDEGKENIHLWYDHSISLRTICLLRYKAIIESSKLTVEKELCEEVVEYIKEGAVWLYNKDNYSNGNHGLMMDAALLQTCFSGDYKEHKAVWFERAIERLENRLKKDFTTKGVNLENSAYYHKLTMEFYIEILDLLKMNNMERTLSAKSRKKIGDMSEFLVFMTMPDGMLPGTGDSRKQPIEMNYGNDKLQYLISNGESGEEPESGFRMYEDAGIGLYREQWNKETGKDSIWWSFKSGAESKMHKQDDDLSFMLYADGNEIFTDAGKFNYDRTDLRRIRAISPMGHNTLSVDGELYNGIRNFKRIGKVKKINESEELIHLRGKNEAYMHTDITRDFVFVKPNTVILIDHFVSNKERTFSQHFLMGENMNIESKNNKGFFAKSNDGKTSVELKQYTNMDDYDYFRGNEENKKGFVFHTEKNINPTDYMEYHAVGKRVVFITTIKLNKEKYGDKISDISLNNNEVSFNVSGEQYSVKLGDVRSEKSFNDRLSSSLGVKNNRMDFIENGECRYSIDTYNKNVLYAFYLFKDGKKICTKDYSQENYIEFFPKEAGKYTCRYFVKSPKEKISDHFDDAINIDDEYLEHLRERSFEIKNQSSMEIEEGRVRYTLECYNPNLEYAFYVYKDGEVVQKKMYSKENYIDVTKEKDEKYTVKWFICKEDVVNKSKKNSRFMKRTGFFE